MHFAEKYVESFPKWLILNLLSFRMEDHLLKMVSSRFLLIDLGFRTTLAQCLAMLMLSFLLLLSSICTAFVDTSDSSSAVMVSVQIYRVY